MKRARIVAALVASLLVVCGLFALCGCNFKTSQSSSKGNNIVVSLPVNTDASGAWECNMDPEGIAKVASTQNAGTATDPTVEFTLSAVADGTTSATFSYESGDSKTSSSATYTLESKDGKLSVTGHSESFSSSF